MSDDQGFSKLESIARRFHEHEVDDPPDEIAGLIHPEARMTLLISHLEPLEGRDAIMAALGREKEAFVYSAGVNRCERLDDWTLLVHGQARYADGSGGMTDGQVWWVDEFLDGLLWRVEAFTSEPSPRTVVGDEPGDLAVR